MLPQPSNQQGGKGTAALGSARAHDVSGSSICKSTHSDDDRTREPLFWQKNGGRRSCDVVLPRRASDRGVFSDMFEI